MTDARRLARCSATGRAGWRPREWRSTPVGGRRGVDGREVDSVRETWLLEDRWWTESPLRRRYWEVVTVCGSDQVVFHDLDRGRWWRQR